MQCLAERLSTAKGIYVLMWIWLHLAFALVQATNLCFCGSNVRWHCATSIDYEAGLPIITEYTIYMAGS